MTDPRLCWLHEDHEPEHWMDPRDRVGVLSAIDGVIQDELPIPAARECATRNGIEPERIVEGYGGPWR